MILLSLEKCNSKIESKIDPFSLEMLEPQVIFFSTLLVSIVTVPLFAFFCNRTGNLRFNPDFKEGLCFAGYNSWQVDKCIIVEAGVTPSLDSKTCYYNEKCDIRFDIPMDYPLHFYILCGVFIFILAMTAPTPSHPWKTRKID